MAFQLTTQSDISALTIALTESALSSLQNESMFAPGGPLHELMWTKNLPLGSKSDQFNRMNSQTAYGATDGVDVVTSGKLSPSGTAVTAAEVVCIVTLTDYGQAGSIDSLSGHAGKEIGFAMGNKWDLDVMALFASLTAGGSTTADLDILDIQTAVQALYVAKHPGPYWSIIHPSCWQHLLAETSMTIGSSSGGFGTIEENIMGSYWQIASPLMGSYFMVSNNVPSATLGADRSNAMLGRDPAIGCVIQTEPRSGSGRWLNRINLQVDESLRATEAVCSSSYGVGVIDSTAGINVLADYEA